ncbi:MAG: DMT family transporter [Devosia sp.]|jgi:drug/metabolite transporter (DMT)-like permease
MTIAATARDVTSVKGLLLGVICYSLFAFHDALVKSVITELPVVQILFIRSFVIVLGCLAVGRRQLLVDLRQSSGKHLIMLRAVLTLGAWCMYYSTGRYLQLAEMTTLYYVAPIITLVLAVIFLRERITFPRIGAAVLGFVGVVVACNPAGLNFAWPELLVLAAAFLWGVAMIAMRSIPRSDSALAQIFAINALYVVVMGVASAFVWQPVDPRVLGIVLAVGLLGGAAQYILVEAARLVPAAVLGTVEYSALVWAFLFGYLGWHEIPAPYVYIGAVLIVAAGAFVAFSERRRGAMLEAP